MKGCRKQSFHTDLNTDTQAHTHTHTDPQTHRHARTHKHTHTHRALTCLDKGPKTGGFSRVLGVVGFISCTKVTVTTDERANCCCCNFLFAYVCEMSVAV